MKSEEKDAIMQAFKEHQVDVLVSTTVIEVGVQRTDTQPLWLLWMQIDLVLANCTSFEAGLVGEISNLCYSGGQS